MVTIKNRLRRPLTLDLEVKGERRTFRLLSKGIGQISNEELQCSDIKECLALDYIMILKME